MKTTLHTPQLNTYASSTSNITKLTPTKKYTPRPLAINSFISPYVTNRIKTTGKLTNSIISKKIETLLLRTRKNTNQLVGGGNRVESTRNNRYHPTVAAFISHYRYTTYDDILQIQRNRTLTLNGHDIAYLQPKKYLNDTLIDYGVQSTIHKNNKTILPLTTHFYSTLRDEGPQKVLNWHRANIFKRKLILIPIHASDHWSLCAIYMPPYDRQTIKTIQPRITHMDSTKIHNGIQIVLTVRNWIGVEWKKYHPQTSLPQTYTAANLPAFFPRVAQQTNGYDCGVYVCNNAMETITYFYTHKNLQDSPNYNITPEQITQFRINMLVDISKRKVRQHGYNQHSKYTINI